LPWLVGILLGLAVMVIAWQQLGPGTRDEGLVSGNGRIEAVEIHVAAKMAGRLKEILVHEGGFVTAGQVVALMDTQSLEAERAQAQAQLRQAEAAVATAHSQLAQRQSEKAAAEALVAQRQAELEAVRRRAARITELASRGDVYMTFFLPTAQVGRLALGDEVRLVLDAAPQRVIPASVTFVADVAQFTPKTVETAIEREKLMFRVKAQIPADLLKKHITHVKTGLPGMAYARLDPEMPWPERLSLMPLQ
jgi:HlyD family secretion protein